ncbi:hypothetical protein [Kribbella speibonae]|uniref:Alpha/beta hydrolase n=1 Tax=Kribbella speibonae TaxID=1572660 RepID=A0A4R0IL54_9ACTN|nr:hypothetical protein [Kribbella speibonae]TCC34263.1 hypothetical protein E0H92_30045 [Kribbella speibonae]
MTLTFDEFKYGTHAAYKQHTRNTGITEFVELPGRGHSLVIDHGWEEVALTALEFIRKHDPTK